MGPQMALLTVLCALPKRDDVPFAHHKYAAMYPTTDYGTSLHSGALVGTSECNAWVMMV